jgi:hypothetical protein
MPRPGSSTLIKSGNKWRARLERDQSDFEPMLFNFEFGPLTWRKPEARRELLPRSLAGWNDVLAYAFTG